MISSEYEELVKKFLGETEFDFTTPAGWEEFLTERTRLGRDHDGFQLRDLKNYDIFAATLYTTNEQVDMVIDIRQPGSGIALYPGALYVYYPQADGTKAVEIFSIGGSIQSHQRLFLRVGEIAPIDDLGRQLEYMSEIYFLILKSSDLPFSDKFKKRGEDALDEVLKESPRFLRRGTKLLNMGGPSYDIEITLGKGRPQKVVVVPQVIVSEELRDELWERVKEVSEHMR